MTKIQKAIQDAIDGVCYDIQNTADSEEQLRMAEAVKKLVEAYGVTTRFEMNKVVATKFATGGLIERKEI